jgi:hypothetical protein
VGGCFLLTQWQNNNKKENMAIAKPSRSASLGKYVTVWNEKLSKS